MKRRPSASDAARPQTRYFSLDDLVRLASMRDGFLALELRKQPTQEGDYWNDPRDLELYDATFGRRIAWKWDAVLGELAARGMAVPGESVLDWGCGSGVAVRRWLAAGGARQARVVYLWDHSPLAREFAARAVRQEFPGLEVRLEIPARPDVLLASHVLGELGEGERAELLERARAAGHVLWVEPGSRLASGQLGEVRASLLDGHEVLAPCPHQGVCGALGGGRNVSWCHFFARPPQEVYTRGEWSELGRELQIDLRSLPYAFLALRRRVPGAQAATRERYRMLGRPRLTRGRAQLDVCDREGVRVLDFLQRFDRALFKELGDTAGSPCDFDAEVEGTRIVALRRRMDARAGDETPLSEEPR